MVGLTVLPHQAGPVYAKYHMEPQNGHIMEEHIITTLKKRGVDCENRNTPLLCHSRCHGYGMALRDADIKKALRKLGLKLLESGTIPHGCRNGANPMVLLGQLTELRSKGPGKGRLGGL